MRRWQIIFFSILFALPLIGRAKGVDFFNGTVYQALDAARAQGKLLIVEFYAPWSHKSRWMHDNVLVKSDLSREFIVISLETATEDGAAFAVQYEVKDYPVILVCSGAGVVIDKIDRTLEPVDFAARLATVRLSTDRQSVRQLQKIFSLCESENPTDRQTVNSLVTNYIASQDLSTLTSQSLWDLFSSPAITYYGSASYLFLVENADRFFSPVEAYSQINTIVLDAIMPYIIGSVEFDQQFISTIESDTLSLSCSAAASELCRLARYRAEGEIQQFILLLSQVIEKVSEDYEFQLIMSLDFIADKIDVTDRSIRTTARKMVEKLRQKSLSPSKTILIESLLAKFS